MAFAKVLGGIILVIIVIAIVSYLVYANLIIPQPPLPENKARLIRYLTCSFALCTYGCKTPEVIDILLDPGLGCNDIFDCNATQQGEHLCGSDYKIPLLLKDEVNYNSNYFVTDAVLNDVAKFGKKNIWFVSGGCYLSVWRNIKLDGFEVDFGCSENVWTHQLMGTCYGTLRGSDSCSKGKTGTNPNVKYWDWNVGTGHLWIDPALATNCEEFTVDESMGTPTGTKYYKNCKFSSGSTIYIWAEPEYDTDGNPVYCPELVLCTS
jgi:hypothetical protein